MSSLSLLLDEKGRFLQTMSKAVSMSAVKVKLKQILNKRIRNFISVPLLHNYLEKILDNF